MPSFNEFVNKSKSPRPCVRDLLELDMLLDLAQSAFDQLFAILPYDQPSDQQLKNCKLVAHRGGYELTENTLAAFQNCLAHNVWGIEFDIRWTKDLVPVVNHDPDTERVFGRRNVFIDQLSFKELQERAPEVPCLSDIVNRFGKKIHFMIEIKTLLSLEQNKILKQILSSLTAKVDYHVLGLSAEIFHEISFAPKSCFLPVAFLNTKEMSQLAIDNGYAGFSGHFWLVNNEYQTKHEQVGQKVGTGFITSKNSLFREINLQREWIFTNVPIKLQKIISNTLNNKQNPIP